MTFVLAVMETGTTTVAGGVTDEATTATGPTDTPTTNARTTMMATSKGVTDEPGTTLQKCKGYFNPCWVVPVALLSCKRSTTQ